MKRLMPLALLAWRRTMIQRCPTAPAALDGSGRLSAAYPAQCQRRDDGTTETPREAMTRTIAAIRAAHTKP